jgi:hypothetical protein
MLISKLRRALQETSDQATVNNSAPLRSWRCIYVKNFLKPAIVSRNWSRHGRCLSTRIMTKKRHGIKSSVAERQ